MSDINELFNRPNPAEDNSKLTGEFWTGLQQQSQAETAQRIENVDRYRVSVSDDEYEILNQAIANAAIPEDEAYNWAVALQYSRNFGTPLAETRANLEAINEYWLGPMKSNPKSNFKAVTDSFLVGRNTVELAGLGADLSAYEANGDSWNIDQVKKRITELNSDNATLGDAQPRPWVIEALKYGAQSAPFTGSVIGAGILGSVFTPIAGTGAAFAESMHQQQGLEYLRLRDQGVEPKYARWISTASGGLQAAVEVALGNVAGNLSKATGANTITSNVLKRLSAKGTFGKIGKILMAYGTEATEEGAEEAIQELIGAGASAIAAELQGQGVDTDTASEIARNTLESFKGGFMGSLVLGLSGTALNARAEFKDATVLRDQAETIDSKEAFVKESAGSVVFEGMTDKDRAEAQDAIWNAAAGKREERINAAAQEIAETTDAGNETVEGVQAEGEDAAPPTTGSAVRLDTGRLHVQEGGSVIQNDDGSTTRVLKVGDPTRETKSNRYGYIRFREYDDRVVVDEFRVGSQYQGIQKEFFQDFAERVAGKEIEWEPMGKRAQALKESIIQENPAGAERGLQYFAKESDPGNIRGRVQLDQAVAQHFPKMNPTERAAAVALLETRASVRGMDLEQYLGSTFQEGVFSPAGNVIPDAAQSAGVDPGKVKGGVSFTKDVSGAVKAMVYVTENSDFSTYVHEVGHVFRRELEGNLLAEAESAFGVKDGKWTRDAEERFAVGFEEYLREGKAPSEGLAALYRKAAEFLRRIYNALANRVEVSPDIRRVYDQLLAGEGPISELTKEADSSNTARAQKMDAQTNIASAPAEANPSTVNAEEESKPEDPSKTFQEKTQDVLAEAGELYKTIPDELFFQSEAVKKLLQEMSREELITMLHQSDSAGGIPNYRAYRRDVADDGLWPVQVSLDADSLKWVNDNMGHSSGDQLLREIGHTLAENEQEFGVKSYHKSGDEFLVQAKTVNDFLKFQEKVDKTLKSAILKATDPVTGHVIEKEGIFISAGIDNKGDMDAADRSLEDEKRYREHTGERAGRGEVPPGIRVRDDTGRDLLDREALAFFERRAEEVKRLSEQKNTQKNEFTPENVRALRKIIQEGGDILFQSVYHGTPHEVDKFTTEKIGTGEGGQSYGWGLYFAESRDVAEWYAQELTKGLGIALKGTLLKDQTGALANSIRLLLTNVKKGHDFTTIKSEIITDLRMSKAPWNIEASNELEGLNKEDITEVPTGHVYQVEIPDQNDFLDWDKPFSAQSKTVQDKILEYSATAPGYLREMVSPLERNATTGEGLYRAIQSQEGVSQKEASLILKAHGIPGIRFLDGNSRTSGSGSYNYVVFSDEDVSITDILFQTEEELVRDAASFDTWQDFMEFYEEGSWSRPADAAVPEYADAQWYQTVWEKARGIVTEESLSEAEVAAQVEADNRTPGSPQTMDAMWLVEMRKPGKLEEFLKRINWILTQKNEFAPADAEEQSSMEDVERMKRRITVELRHGSWISNATRLGVGRELTDKARRTLLTLMSNAPRDYRALYGDLMEDEDWSVALADTESGRLASIADPEIDYTEMTPEQRRKIAEKIDNAEIAGKLRSGDLTIEEAERHIKYLNSQLDEKQKEIRKLEKEEDDFRAEVGSDYRRISDWQTRRLLELKDELDIARARHESRSDQTSRMIERGQAITRKYQLESQQIKAGYDTIFRKFSDLSKAMEISGAVKTALARRESLFEARAESARLRSQISANREARKIRTQLVKKTMRRVRFQNVDYENARKIIAIQRKFTPALLKGLNKWIGTEGPYLREVYSRWKTDEAFRVKLSEKLGRKKKFGKISRLLEKDFDTWTNSERELALDFFPKEDWIEELNLDALTAEREESLQFDEKSGEIQKIVAEALPARILARIEGRPFAEWTIEEMEELAATVDELYSDGRRQLEAKKEAARADADRLRSQIKKVILDAGISADDSPEEQMRKRKDFEKKLGFGHVKGTVADSLERRSFRSRLMNKGYIDANVRRVARILDGGKDGVNTDLLYHQEDLCYNAEHRMIRERNAVIAKAMEETGVTINDLYETVTIKGLMDGRDETFTVDELLFVLKADEDKVEAKDGTVIEQSKRAIMYGNLLSDTEKETWGSGKSGEEALNKIAEPRYQAVLAAAQALPEKVRRFADAISADYSEQYERMNAASIAEFNQPVWRVAHYVPLVRLESGGDTNENRVAEDLLGMSSTRKQTGTDKGMTQKRIDIAAAYMRPVQLGLYSTWVDSVKRTEHFIAYAPYVRELNRVYKSVDAGNLRGWIRNRYGDGMLKYIDQYVNETANPEAIGEQSRVDRTIKAIRGRTASAYLAWKMSGILKQFVTSPAPYFAHVSPAEYAAAAFDLVKNFQDISSSIREKSVFMENRVMDPIIDLIREQQAKTGNKAAAAWDRFNDLGMKGLEFADWSCVAPGWLAVYRKTLATLESENKTAYEKELARLRAENESGLPEAMKTEAEMKALAEKKVLEPGDIELRAVKAADDVTRLCQPSNRLTDLAPLFKERGKGTEALKILTQFQTSLNVIWQNIRYDLPQAVRDKEWSTVVGMIGGYVAAGVAVNLMTQGFGGGDDDDAESKMRTLVYYGMTQFTDAVPLVGDAVNTLARQVITGSTGYQGSDDFYPAISKIFQAGMAVAEGDWERSAARTFEGFGYAFGAPVSGIKEAGRAVGIGDGNGTLEIEPGALFGRR